jgi:hypothetical protein
LATWSIIITPRKPTIVDEEESLPFLHAHNGENMTYSVSKRIVDLVGLRIGDISELHFLAIRKTRAAWSV